jgi:hypothetical protein
MSLLFFSGAAPKKFTIEQAALSGMEEHLEEIRLPRR